MIGSAFNGFNFWHVRLNLLKLITAFLIILIFAALPCLAGEVSASPDKGKNAPREEKLVEPADETLAPPDFRGIKFGAGVGKIKNLVPLYNEKGSDTSIYTMRGDSLTFGGAKLHSIEYLFIKDKLDRVSLIAKGAQEQKALLDEAKKLYGNESVNRGSDFLWRFSKVVVLYSDEPEYDQAALVYAPARELPAGSK